MLAIISKNEALNGGDYADKLVKVIEKSTKNIEIMMFDWRWYKNDLTAKITLINQALVRAVNRGVVVTAYTSSQTIVNTLHSVGIRARRHDKRSCMHVKQVTIDDRITVIGSHNFTNSAMRANIECSVMITDEKFTIQQREYFNKIWLSSKA